ncbi:MAG TPA: DUF5655 domain-containing protein [Symbiobacteriaceae bacterium]|nr:DUF5655 domain-containing protein [Symbiobacteriaceae bacterium]
MEDKKADRLAKMTASLQEKTGKDLAEWKVILAEAGLLETTPGQKVKWLKETHGVTHGYAEVIGWMSVRPADYEAPTFEAVIDAQYSGKKAPLRPIYERLFAAAMALGPDVKTEICQGYVPLIRKRQFAVIQPSTLTRIDVGLRLPGIEPAGRLQPSKGVGGGSITHKIAITSIEEADEEVLGWLKRAYELEAVKL